MVKSEAAVKILEGFRSGKSPKELIVEGYNKNTTYKYYPIYQRFASVVELHKQAEQQMWSFLLSVFAEKERKFDRKQLEEIEFS